MSAELIDWLAFAAWWVLWLCAFAWCLHSAR